MDKEIKNGCQGFAVGFMLLAVTNIVTPPHSLAAPLVWGILAAILWNVGERKAERAARAQQYDPLHTP